MQPGSSATASYWMPLMVFGVFTAAEGYAPPSWYPWIYLAKVGAVLGTLLIFPRSLADIRPSRLAVLPAVVAGIAIFGQWMLIEHWIPYPHLGTRTAFNPFAELATPTALWTLLTARFFGLVVLVPIIEETFWRNFGLRYATNQDFEAVPVGTFSVAAFWIAAIGSAVTHPEWLAALVTGILLALFLRWTRSMFAVILAHGVANLALGTYIVTTGDWQYW